MGSKCCIYRLRALSVRTLLSNRRLRSLLMLKQSCGLWQGAARAERDKGQLVYTRKDCKARLAQQGFLMTSGVKSYTIDKIAAYAIDFPRDESVYVGLETREFFIEITCEFQVIDDGAVEALTRDQ